MISVSQIAEQFQNGLNALIDYPNLTFKLWATAGERQAPERTGNVINTYINGEIKTTSSSITPNILVVGANYLTLVFDVPVDPPKTTTAQTAQDLQRVVDGQYWFLQYISGILSGYFQKYQTFTLQDESGTEFSVGMVAGVAVPQDIDLTPWRGNSIPVYVYVELNIGQGGIISLDVSVELDGAPLPYQVFTPDRTGVLDPAVYAGETVSKVLSTSTAFAAEVTIPTNTVYASSQSAVDYLLQGPQNEVHFLQVTWGENGQTGLYLVTFTRETGGVQGVTLASATFRIAEVRADPDMVELPSGFQMGYFEVASSSLSSITLSVSADCLGYIGEQAYSFTANQSVTVQLTPQSIIYDDATEQYRVYLITSSAVTVTATGYAFEVV